MCGIAGIVGAESTIAQPRVERMLAAIEQRGPDDHGLYSSADGHPVALGHRRLAILDLSPLGHQPMLSRSGRYVITFNGEIYNFLSLREQLRRQGTEFASHSDTEVILELYAKHGPECVQALDGMFALAIWDTYQQKLFCARDPLGIKPFYYWHVNGHLAFASEVRSVLQADLAPRRLDAAAAESYLLFGSVQEPDTLVMGVSSLPAGHTLTWQAGQLRLEQYWQLSFDHDAQSAITDDYAAVKSRVRSALDESIARHFVSDVPVGIFLSGGIDSTAVVAMAHAQGAKPLQTFCISFDQPEFDEGQLAERTAAHFGTEHHQWKMTPAEGKDLFQEFLQAFDLPSNDGFNTYCVSRFARDHGLKVVLSGLGGDELFGGYPSFQFIPKLIRLHQQTRWLGVQFLAGLAARLPLSLRNQRMLGFLQSSGSTAAAHWAVRGFFLPGEIKQILQGFGITSNPLRTIDDQVPGRDLADQVAWLEATRYMRNQLLRDSDVMSMAVSLELRTPLVDRRLMDVVSAIPARLRLQPGKRLLTDAVPEVPAWILNNVKRGFRFPLEDWVSGHWRDMFASIERRMPLALRTWPRKWTVLLLEEFISRHGLVVN